MSAPKKVGTKRRHRVMVDGARSSGTLNTKAAALAWEATVRTAKPAGQLVTQTCLDAFEKYEREVSAKKKGARWEGFRLAAFGRSDFAKVLIREVNASHVAAWRDQRVKAVSGATVNREMNLLSNVFTVARKEWKWIKESPTADVSRPKDGKPRFRRIVQAEIDQICIALG